MHAVPSENPPPAGPAAIPERWAIAAVAGAAGLCLTANFWGLPDGPPLPFYLLPLLVAAAIGQILLVHAAGGFVLLSLAVVTVSSSPSLAEFVVTSLLAACLWPLGIRLARYRTAVKSLRAKEATFQVIFDNTFEFVGLLSPDGAVLIANASALRAGGVRAEQVLGRPFWETVWWNHAPDQQARLRQAIARAAGGEFDRFEATHPTPDGALIHVDFSIKPIKDAGDRVIYLLPEGRDITKLRRMEDSLRQKTLELERSNRELERFGYVASHDLRAPLRNIADLAQWIEEDAGQHLPDEPRQFLAMLRQRAALMEQLINDLLQYSRVGRVESQPEEVDLEQLLDEIRLLANIPPGFRVETVPPLPRLWAPRTALYRVLLNLVDNAVKHHHRRDGLVQISGQDLPDRYEISVSDDGPGIAPEYHERIFEIFQTLKRRDDVPASGMGLAMVRRTIEWYGGSIWVNSQEGHGATFTFTWLKRPPAEVTKE